MPPESQPSHTERSERGEVVSEWTGALERIANAYERMATAAERQAEAVAGRPAVLQTCPVCGGCCTVPADFYARLGSSTSLMREQCRACKGAGVVVVRGQAEEGSNA